MAIQVYDSLQKRKLPFESREPGVVRMYNCGPTVYGRAHIGNLRSFLFADVLRRWLEYRGYTVQQVMNITDVGHLQDDQHDAGEDKLEAAARKAKLDPAEIARGFEQKFLEDMQLLNVLEPKARPRATEHVQQMLAIIDDLIEKGHAYEVNGNVYFDVSTFPSYGRLSGNRVEDLEAGARIEVRDEKRNPADFALWKSDPAHIMKWPSRFGPDGFPGWHIECSAMALEHLGQELDIHTGGEDNIFPHHECEIAQSECHTEKPFARYWMHAKFLQVDGGKMSKSLGNVYDVDDVQKRASVRALRFSLIRGHYRQPLNFTWEILEEAEGALRKLDGLLDRVDDLAQASASADSDPERGSALLAQAIEKFEGGMDDDLNVPVALSALFELRSFVLEEGLGSRAAADAGAFLRRAIGQALGLEKTQDDASAGIEQLILARRAARANKDWAESDRIRDELVQLKIEIQDAPDGTTHWQGPPGSGIVR